MPHEPTTEKGYLILFRNGTSIMLEANSYSTETNGQWFFYEKEEGSKLFARFEGTEIIGIAIAESGPRVV